MTEQPSFTYRLLAGQTALDEKLRFVR